MTRISENQASRQLVSNTLDNKRKLNQYANELSTGYKVMLPGDSNDAGTISRYRDSIEKINSYSTTIAQAKSFLQYQDDSISQVNELLTRATDYTVHVPGAPHELQYVRIFRWQYS